MAGIAGPLVFSVLLIVAVIANPENSKGRKSFKGYQVLSVRAENEMQLEYLNLLQAGPEIDFFQVPSLAQKTDILVPPNQLREVKKSLRKMKLDFAIINEDMENTIERERRDMATRATGDIWTTYLMWEDFELWLQEKSTNFPGMMELKSIGKSNEGRDIWQVKVAADINAPKKPAMYIECLAHAREWITGSACLGTIDILTANYGKSGTLGQQATLMLDKFDWYFIPMMNPDGYNFSKQNRLWRKNRRVNVVSSCPGVDLNRNFAADWGGAGSSSNWCSDTYRGGSANSEPEAQAVINAVAETGDVRSYLSIHSYSQLLLVPYAYDNVKAPDYNELKNVGDIAMLALRQVNGVNFVVGHGPEILYAASGGAFDYFKLNGVKYAYVYELRPASGSGTDGFILPASQIDPSIRETFASFYSFADQIPA
ncbi:carboxypeptidase A2-like [Saccostrea echinata]|uniref:carboxypeptidase A2-like n=1 Tax=Saccostrea echinata TaxID=191078 RepID=UPI002A7F1454|nr:carboxypeptidase A2-like [Saccostrea echinata]